MPCRSTKDCSRKRKKHKSPSHRRELHHLPKGIPSFSKGAESSKHQQKVIERETKCSAGSSIRSKKMNRQNQNERAKGEVEAHDERQAGFRRNLATLNLLRDHIEGRRSLSSAYTCRECLGYPPVADGAGRR